MKRYEKGWQIPRDKLSLTVRLIIRLRTGHDIGYARPVMVT